MAQIRIKVRGIHKYENTVRIRNKRRKLTKHLSLHPGDKDAEKAIALL